MKPVRRLQCDIAVAPHKGTRNSTRANAIGLFKAGRHILENPDRIGDANASNIALVSTVIGRSRRRLTERRSVHSDSP